MKKSNKLTHQKGNAMTNNESDNHVLPHSLCTRRSFLKVAGGSVLAAGTAGAATQDVASKPASASGAPSANNAFPSGKIGDLQITRLILGSNIITHHVHSLNLSFVQNLARRYNTDERVLKTFAEAQARGINTFMTHNEPSVIRLFREFRERQGGKMNWIVAPSPGDSQDVSKFETTVQQLVDNGVDALYIHGAISDPLVSSGKVDLIKKYMELMKATGLPSGVAAHDLDVVKACESVKLPCDFYLKTFHHLNYPTAPQPQDIVGPNAETPHGYWCAKPQETAEFMKSVKQPWIGFKVMAAGAIKPREAFQYAYGNGVDFILAGMFDFEIADDVQTAKEVLAGIVERPQRPWRG
jgi:hypothetical protein